MLNKKFRLYIGVVTPVLTILACTWYLSSHHALANQLIHTKPRTLVSVFLMYALMVVMLILILDATLRICVKKLNNNENFLLNAYSLLANFFIPGQSGPAIRGAYLKKRRSLKIRNFIAVTLLYYLLYAAVSILMLVWGSKSWHYTLLAGLVLATGVSLAIFGYLSLTKFKTQELDLRVRNIFYLLLVTALQAAIQATIYSIELHSNPGQPITLNNVIAYTGAANLALFVALTPGAIGIRESFLLSTQKLHHINSSSIVVANVIDRSVYLIFLLALGVFLLILSLQNRNQAVLKLLPAKVKGLVRSSSQENSSA